MAADKVNEELVEVKTKRGGGGGVVVITGTTNSTLHW